MFYWEVSAPQPSCIAAYSVDRDSGSRNALYTSSLTETLQRLRLLRELRMDSRCLHSVHRPQIQLILRPPLLPSNRVSQLALLHCGHLVARCCFTGTQFLPQCTHVFPVNFNCSLRTVFLFFMGLARWGIAYLARIWSAANSRRAVMLRGK